MPGQSPMSPMSCGIQNVRDVGREVQSCGSADALQRGKGAEGD